MFSIMPQTPPRFSFGRAGDAHHRHRPAFSSPLSSSPIRASSPSPPPQQPGMNQQQQQQNFGTWGSNPFNTMSHPQHTQSSPIFPSRTGLVSPTSTDQNSAGFNSSTNPKFRFATRNARPNPVLRRREDAQETRRRLFFQNVRQRQEDKRWEMRGGEDELMRLEWTRFTREYQQALEEQIIQTLGPALDADVAAREEEELRRLQMEMQMQSNNLPDRELDVLMADEIARQEEAEMQAMLEELEREQAQKAQEHQFSDDEYDDVFMELIQQQEAQGRSMAYSQDVEMS